MENDFGQCVSASSDGISLDLEVSPSAKASSIDGVNPWRRRIKVSIAAEARDGGANRALLKFLAEVFGVLLGSVRLASGEKSSQKRVLVSGMSVEQAEKSLEAAHGRR